MFGGNISRRQGRPPRCASMANLSVDRCEPATACGSRRMQLTGVARCNEDAPIGCGIGSLRYARKIEFIGLLDQLDLESSRANVVAFQRYASAPYEAPQRPGLSKKYGQAVSAAARIYMREVVVSRYDAPISSLMSIVLAGTVGPGVVNVRLGVSSRHTDGM